MKTPKTVFFKSKTSQDYDSKEKDKKDSSKAQDLVKYKIRLLDEEHTPLQFDLTKSSSGKYLFDLVCDGIEKVAGCTQFKERDYFGLRYADKYNQRQWLDMDKSVYKQMKECKTMGLNFRVKHYPVNPVEDLKQELTKYLFSVQIRRDLTQGRLLCRGADVGRMGALVAQAILGDAPAEADHLTSLAESPSSSNADAFTKTYLSGYKIINEQTRRHEIEIMQQHAKLRGMSQSDTTTELLLSASKLPSYGIDPFPVWPLQKVAPPKLPTETLNETDESGDQTGRNSNKSSEPQKVSLPDGSKFYIGIAATGINTFVGITKNQEFNWEQIDRIGCDGKIFFFELVKKKKSTSSIRLWVKNTTLRYQCASKSAALALWQWSLDRKCFFTLKHASEAKKVRSFHSLFRRSHTFRFSGRPQQELSSEHMEDSHVNYARLSGLKRNSQSDDSGELKYHTLPSRVRPALDMKESFVPLETTDNFKNSPTVAEQATPTAVISPILDEQPILEKDASTKRDPEITESNDTGAATAEASENPVIEEAIIPMHSSVVRTKTDNPLTGYTSAVVTTHDKPIVDSMNTKNLNSDSLDRQKALSDLDQAINMHHTSLNFTNQMNKRNGQLKQSKVDTFAESNGPYISVSQEKPFVYTGVTSLSDVSTVEQPEKTVVNFSSTTVAAAATITVAVLLGLVLFLEFTPTETSGALKLLRHNVLVKSIDSYLYSPVRNTIAACFQALWT